MRDVTCTVCMWRWEERRASVIGFRTGMLPLYLCSDHAITVAPVCSRIAPISDRMRANIVEGRSPYAHRQPTSTMGE